MLLSTHCTYPFDLFINFRRMFFGSPGWLLLLMLNKQERVLLLYLTLKRLLGVRFNYLLTPLPYGFFKREEEALTWDNHKLHFSSNFHWILSGRLEDMNIFFFNFNYFLLLQHFVVANHLITSSFKRWCQRLFSFNLLTLNRLFNNYIRLYQYPISSSWNMKGTGKNYHKEAQAY